MNNVEFHSKENKNLRNLIKHLEHGCGDIQLVSYGHSPNSMGFCYEVYNDLNKDYLIKLDQLLDSLNKEQIKVIKELYLY